MVPLELRLVRFQASRVGTSDPTCRASHGTMSQGTDMQAASGQTTSVPAQQGPPRRAAAAVLDWLKKDLFLRTESSPVGWRKILIAVACVIAGTAISLSRTVGAGSLNTIWIQGRQFLAHPGPP